MFQMGKMYLLKSPVITTAFVGYNPPLSAPICQQSATLVKSGSKGSHEVFQGKGRRPSLVSNMWAAKPTKLSHKSKIMLVMLVMLRMLPSTHA